MPQSYSSSCCRATAWVDSLNESEKTAFETDTKSNATITRLSAADTESLKVRLAPIEKGWAEKARKKGVADPEAVVEALRKDIALGKK